MFRSFVRKGVVFTFVRLVTYEMLGVRFRKGTMTTNLTRSKIQVT